MLKHWLFAKWSAYVTLKHKVFAPPIFEVDGNESSYHLYLLRLNGYSETQRDSVITKLAEANISANVHFQPLPLLTYYKNLGYKMVDYPNAFAAYENEISLPVWYGMSDEMLDYVIEQVEKAVSSL
jgi:dTDP-4-amino-4,6-dideoxygalactose transaminase